MYNCLGRQSVLQLEAIIELPTFAKLVASFHFISEEGQLMLVSLFFCLHF